MRRVLLVAMLFATMFFPSFATSRQASAQDVSQDLLDAAYAAGQILQFANQRQFSAMYDMIHPDSKRIVPRVAAVGAFDVIYAQAEAGPAEIYDGRMTSYTYPVTGETYSGAAEIDYRQEFTQTNGERSVLEQKMFLVKADGVWSWFFGSSPEFVTTVVELYGMPAEPPVVEGDLVRNVALDLDAFYTEVLGYTDFKYASPGFVYVPIGQSVRTACGPAKTGFWGFFCPGDVTIYVDESLIAELQDKADFAAAFVIAHEWAHHVQTLVSFDRVKSSPDEWNEVWSIELELMADCMAGAWAQDLQTRGRLEVDDYDEAVSFTIQYLGDPQYVDRYSEQAHGSAEERVAAFKAGFSEGFSACNIVM